MARKRRRVHKTRISLRIGANRKKVIRHRDLTITVHVGKAAKNKRRLKQGLQGVFPFIGRHLLIRGR